MNPLVIDWSSSKAKFIRDAPEEPDLSIDDVVSFPADIGGYRFSVSAFFDDETGLDLVTLDLEVDDDVDFDDEDEHYLGAWDALTAETQKAYGPPAKSVESAALTEDDVEYWRGRGATHSARWAVYHDADTQMLASLSRGRVGYFMLSVEVRPLDR